MVRHCFRTHEPAFLAAAGKQQGCAEHSSEQGASLEVIRHESGLDPAQGRELYPRHQAKTGKTLMNSSFRYGDLPNS